MTWEDILKDEQATKYNEKMKEFVDEVMKNAERILDKYTTDYNIDDVPEANYEIREALERVFIQLVLDMELQDYRDIDVRYRNK